MANITFTEGSGLQDSIYGKDQAPIRMLIEKHGEAFEQKSVIKEIFDMEKSNNFGEVYTGMTAMSGFQPVGENGAYPVDGMQQGYRKFVEHMTWKNTFSISREIADDTKSMDLTRQPVAFTTAYYRTRENFGAALLGAAARGATSAAFSGKMFDTTTADGVCLFSKAHPSILGKTKQSNQFSDAFSNDALAAMETEMQNFKGDNGEILDVSPDTILIPNDAKLKMAVFEAIGADKSPNTANNGWNYNCGRWNVITWPALNQFITAGTSPWILLDTSYSKLYGGAIWLDRTPLEVKSRIDDANDANVWSGYARFIAAFNDWRFAAVGGVSGGTTLISA